MVNGVYMCVRYSVLDLLEKVYPRPNKRRLAAGHAAPGVNGLLLEGMLRRITHCRSRYVLNECKQRSNSPQMMMWEEEFRRG